MQACEIHSWIFGRPQRRPAWFLCSASVPPCGSSTHCCKLRKCFVDYANTVAEVFHVFFFQHSQVMIPDWPFHPNSHGWVEEPCSHWWHLQRNKNISSEHQVTGRKRRSPVRMGRLVRDHGKTIVNQHFTGYNNPSLENSILEYTSTWNL